MKILLSNFGYGSAGDGKYRNYIWNYMHSRKKVEISLNKFGDIIAQHNPDIVCVCEVKKTQIQSNVFLNIPYKIDGWLKYDPKDKLGKYILGHHRFNAVLSKEDYKIEYKYLSHGNKKLIYKLHLGNNSFLYFGHFSLRKYIRKKQFLELARMINPSENNIVCGDFNIFSGYRELTELSEIAQLKISKNSATFPSHKPKLHVDIFLVSKYIDIKTRVISDIFSDHLAVVGEIDINDKNK
ncbi:endonuclease/exonuclease/phosphatase family protein [Candidatus Gracilibacteria bacterium]|nr:endonuclease/exonuclease/phosphatase family protein [Candidatus Gracilibacteria bacterium]